MCVRCAFLIVVSRVCHASQCWCPLTYRPPGAWGLLGAIVPPGVGRGTVYPPCDASQATAGNGPLHPGFPGQTAGTTRQGVRVDLWMPGALGADRISAALCCAVPCHTAGQLCGPVICIGGMGTGAGTGTDRHGQKGGHTYRTRGISGLSITQLPCGQWFTAKGGRGASSAHGHAPALSPWRRTQGLSCLWECRACSAHAVRSFGCRRILGPYFWPFLTSFWFHTGFFFSFLCIWDVAHLNCHPFLPIFNHFYSFSIPHIEVSPPWGP